MPRRARSGPGLRRDVPLSTGAPPRTDGGRWDAAAADPDRRAAPETPRGAPAVQPRRASPRAPGRRPGAAPQQRLPALHRALEDPERCAEPLAGPGDDGEIPLRRRQLFGLEADQIQQRLDLGGGEHQPLVMRRTLGTARPGNEPALRPPIREPDAERHRLEAPHTRVVLEHRNSPEGMEGEALRRPALRRQHPLHRLLQLSQHPLHPRGPRLRAPVQPHAAPPSNLLI